MGMTSTISELSPPARRRACAVDGDTMETVCNKRRRRDPAAASYNNQLPEQQQLLQADQPTATIVKRSSKFRGVSRHRWTGRYEAHLWDKGSWNPTQRKKGKQGAYDEEESAARAYDLAALKYWGTSTFTNFPVPDYDKEIEIMASVTKEEYLASLRRRSSGFSRGVSKYRGVAKHHHNGRWEARIGRVFGNKYLYLGTYSTQEEAAHAYDIAAIEYRGINAVTNFDLSTYIRWLKPGANRSPPFEEQKLSFESQPMTNLCNHIIPKDQTTNLSIFNSNPFKVETLDSTPKTKHIFQTKTPISTPCTKSSSSSSSPTALSLLLRSSVFKELVEKNLNSTNKESSGKHDTKNLPQQIGNDDEVGKMFFNEIGVNSVQYMCPSSKMYCLA
ncbi:hypothetical protein Patl1_16347 [Pistacia atlantica]|uniref:Uncharacterized protein n=1 Tax=Pistacia atlantica TaxID=434234 RepID=A0ACC1B903_9ROSI|nr:hypothetical protein Patl1_16347 [Pistacia atlantica]